MKETKKTRDREGDTGTDKEKGDKDIGERKRHRAACQWARKMQENK